MNQLKIGAILNYVSIALNMFIGLVYTPFLLRSLGQSEYGLYSLATSLIAYLTVLDLGFGDAIIRYTTKLRAEQKTQEQSYMFGMFFLLYCLIGLISFISGSLLAMNADNLFSYNMTQNEIDRTKIMLWLMTINLTFTFPMSIWGSIMSAYERFIFQKVVSIIRSILNPLTMLVLLAFGYKAVALVIITTVFNFITLIINYFYCKKQLKISVRFGNINIIFLKEIAIFSFWVFLTAIADKIYWSTGQVILGIYCGTAIIAVFAISIQLKEMYYLFSSAISGVFLPRVTTMVTRGASVTELTDLLIRTGRLQFIVMAFILTTFIIFGKAFVCLWAGPDYIDAYYIAILFFSSTTIPLIQNITISILMALNKLKNRSLIIAIASFVGLVLSIPSFKYGGAIGGAIAISSTIIVTYGIILNLFYNKSIGLDVCRFWKEILKMALVPALFVFGGLFAQPYLEIDSLFKFFQYVACFGAIYLPLFYITSMNDYEKKLFTTPILIVKNLLSRNRQ